MKGPEEKKFMSKETPGSQQAPWKKIRSKARAMKALVNPKSKPPIGDTPHRGTPGMSTIPKAGNRPFLFSGHRKLLKAHDWAVMDHKLKPPERPPSTVL